MPPGIFGSIAHAGFWGDADAVFLVPIKTNSGRGDRRAAIPADAAEAMRYSHDVLIPDMDTARRAADQLETLTGSDRWPFPTYSDLLFSV